MNRHHHHGSHTRSSYEKDARTDNPHHHHARAHKIVALIETNVKEAITSVDNLKVDTHHETMALLAETNSFANDLQALVHAILRLVIKSYKKDKPTHDVASSAKVFSDYVLTIQKSFHQNIPVLKNNLKQALNGAVPEAHKLLKLLDQETHTASRHAIVKVLDDLLFVVKKLLHRNQIEQATVERLEEIATSLIHKTITELAKLTNTDHHTMGEFNAVTSHAIRHMILASRTIDEDAVGYEGEIESKLQEIAYHLSEDLAMCDKAVRTKHNLDALKEHVTICSRQLVDGLKQLALLGKSSAPENVMVTLNNLIRVVYAHSMATGEQYFANVDHISHFRA